MRTVTLEAPVRSPLLSQILTPEARKCTIKNLAKSIKMKIRFNKATLTNN